MGVSNLSTTCNGKGIGGLLKVDVPFGDGKPHVASHAIVPEFFNYLILEQ